MKRQPWNSTGRIEYPFPLSGVERMATLELPADLTSAEADRLCAFVRSLVIDEDEPVEQDEVVEQGDEPEWTI